MRFKLPYRDRDRQCQGSTSALTSRSSITFRLRLGLVVVAEEMQDAVDDQVGEMMGEGFGFLLAPPAPVSYASAISPRWRGPALPGSLLRALGRRKRQHVGRLVLSAPGAGSAPGSAASSVSSTLTSQRLGPSRPAATAAASAARWPAASASGQARPSPALSHARRRVDHGLRPLHWSWRKSRVVGGDDPAHEVVADHVLLLEGDAGDALDAVEDSHRLDQARISGPAAGRSGSDRR